MTIPTEIHTPKRKKKNLDCEERIISEGEDVPEGVGFTKDQILEEIQGIDIDELSALPEENKP